ncbi:hypothetical protein ACGFH8_11915 [Micromonospora sp. NPDC049175]
MSGRSESRTVLMPCGCYVTVWGNAARPASCGTRNCAGPGSLKVTR